MTPKQIADQCIGAGFQDYEPDKYCTIRIGKAIERAIEAERAVQMGKSSRDESGGQHVSGNPKSAADEQGSSGERA